MDYWREVVLQEIGFFAGPETSQHQNGFAHAGFADVDAFVGAGDAEPVGAGLLEDFGDLRAAVAVAVALDDGENLARRLALFAGRIDEVADGAQVVGERGFGNFGPHRPAFDVQLLRWVRRHGGPERKIVYDIRAAGVGWPRGWLRERQHCGGEQSPRRC